MWQIVGQVSDITPELTMSVLWNVMLLNIINLLIIRSSFDKKCLSTSIKCNIIFIIL